MCLNTGAFHHPRSRPAQMGIDLLDPASVTIDALFKTAENVLTLNDPETDMTFNQTYGYPNSIIYEDASWVTDDFKLLDDE